MENATKALIIAGAVMIAILILSLGVYLFAKFSDQNKQYKEMVSSIEIQKYNSQFDTYIGRTDITAQEVVTALSLANEYPYMNVVVYAGSFSVHNDDPETLLMWYNGETFSCTNYTYSDRGVITSISFTKN